jgi:hypothetical protein
MLSVPGSFPALTDLMLERNGIGDRGIEELVTSSALPNLKRLNLRRNRLGPRSAELLCESALAKRLAYLNVEYNEGIGRAGMTLLLETFDDQVF